MLADMPGRQWSLWQAHYQRTPFGPWRDNWNAANIAFAVTRAAGMKARFEHFMYREPNELKEQQSLQVVKRMMMIAKEVPPSGN